MCEDAKCKVYNQTKWWSVTFEVALSIITKELKTDTMIMNEFSEEGQKLYKTKSGKIMIW